MSHCVSGSAATADFLDYIADMLPYRVEAMLTDNALAFTMRHELHSDRLRRFQQVCQLLLPQVEFRQMPQQAQ